MIHFVSANVGKVHDVQAIITDVRQLDLDLIEIQSLDSNEVITHKLAEAVRHHNGPLFVDDTCMVLNCIAPLPGPLMKQFIKGIGLDGITNLVAKYADNRAIARTTLGLHDIQGANHFFTGEITGHITTPIGSHGFGWDAIFIPDGFDKTFAELGPDIKRRISMRTIALKKLADYLRS